MEIYRQELINSLKELSIEGFRCFILKENPSFLYGFIITSSDNVLYIQRDAFKTRGWTLTLEYKPSKKNGTGCQCFDNPFETITKDIVLQAEQEGMLFAKKLDAELYENSNEFIEKLWNLSEFGEVV